MLSSNKYENNISKISEKNISDYSDNCILEFRNITKSYGMTSANKNISFSVMKGEILGLIGENGAGKSTLMRILFGLEKLDSGEIFWQGNKIHFSSPRNAKEHGIGMVEQHFHLAEQISALDHILLEQNHTSGSKLNPLNFFKLILPLSRKKTRNKLEDLTRKNQLPLVWSKTVHELSIGEKQRLEILKLLSLNSNFLILDEPTAVLSPPEVENFLKYLKNLRSQGKTIILITHKLPEVMAVCDRVVVLRNGEVVDQSTIANETPQSLAQKMVGSSTAEAINLDTNGELINKSRLASNSKIDFESKSVLQFKNLEIKNKKNNLALLGPLNFCIQTGKIIGIAGVHGNGQSLLTEYCLMPENFSNQKFETSGTATLFESELNDLTSSHIRQMHVSYISEDRHQQGIATEFSTIENFMIGRSEVFNQTWLQTSNAETDFKNGINKFDLRPNRLLPSILNYSGGNQQKIVVNRETCQNPKLLIACEPTRGVDIVAAQKIHQAILEVVNSNKKNAGSVLLISSDLDELIKLSDEIIVLYRGKQVLHLNNSNFDRTKIGLAMAGLSSNQIPTADNAKNLIGDLN